VAAREKSMNTQNNEITKSEIYAMTIASANRIASQHEDDPNWDFWTFMEETNEHVSREDGHQMA
jgi:hypothetical protein